jgi:protein-tyrosine phosphatase
MMDQYQDQEQNSQPVPFPNSFWVIPGKFLAGEYPGDLEPQRAQRKLANMLQLGINVFVDLTHPEDSLSSYHSIAQEVASEFGVEVEIYAYPIEDFSTPMPLEMKAILDRIDRALAEDKRVYVHCLGGIGRTGTVVGCYLVRHGLEGEAAIRRLNELRKSTPKSWYQAPESDEQRRMILEWRAGG